MDYKSERECYASENCNVYCGFPGQTFTRVDRDDPNLPQELKRQIQRCVARSCEDREELHAYIGAHFMLHPDEWEYYYNRVLSVLRINDINYVEIIDTQTTSMTLLACAEPYFEHGFIITFIMDPELSRESFQDMVRIHQLFAKEGFAPQILATSPNQFVVMEKPRGGMLATLMRKPMSAGDIQMLGESILDFVEWMCAMGFYLPRLTIQQIGYADDLPIEIFNWQDIKLQVVDFQYVFRAECDYNQTIQSLIRSLDTQPNMMALGRYLETRIQPEREIDAPFYPPGVNPTFSGQVFRGQHNNRVQYWDSDLPQLVRDHQEERTQD